MGYVYVPFIDELETYIKNKTKDENSLFYQFNFYGFKQKETKLINPYIAIYNQTSGTRFIVGGERYATFLFDVQIVFNASKKMMIDNIIRDTETLSLYLIEEIEDVLTSFVQTLTNYKIESWGLETSRQEGKNFADELVYGSSSKFSITIKKG